MVPTRDSRSDRTAFALAALTVFVALVCLLVVPAPAAAHSVDQGDATNATAHDLCEFPHPEWRAEQTVAGVHVQASEHCRPDNPAAVAAAVRGTDDVPDSVLARTGYAEDAVVKSTDRDGDGDPDVVNVTLEVAELNGGGLEHRIAPGVSPGMWVFAPKTTGMLDNGTQASALVRAPSPPIRVEQGDTVHVTLENTHYLPHTIHFHGVDHPAGVDGNASAGGDGVPQTSETPLRPGESRTYTFTPRTVGTMFYHCHVVPSVHVQMGLAGMFVVTEDRPDNAVQTLNIGAGKVRHPPSATDESYAGVYDMHYESLDANLSRIPGSSNDPRTVAEHLNRDYDSTDATVDYYLLNGRSYPYTLQESPVVVEPDERYRLRVLNSGPRDVALHTHGHKVTVEAYDGVESSESNEVTRDVVDVAPAQRVDLTLNTTDDGTHAYGDGVWLLHDHREPAVTTDGISPGGNVDVIAYASHVNDATAMPEVDVDVGRYFNASYYDGDVPYWSSLGPKFADEPVNATPSDATVNHWADAAGSRMRVRRANGGVVYNELTDELPYGCQRIAGTRNVTVRAGESLADPGHMYAYDGDQWDVDTCTRVNVTLENGDDVRHQWMVHGLLQTTYPMRMFTLEADPGATVTGTFVTPSFDAELLVHCSLPTHGPMGMNGTLVVGTPGTAANATTGAAASSTEASETTAANATADATTRGSSAGLGASSALVALCLLGAALVRRRE